MRVPLLVLLLLALSTGAAIAQTDGRSKAGAMVLGAPTAVPDDTPTPVPTATATGTPTPPASAPEATVAPSIQAPQANNAARRGGPLKQRKQAKDWEVRYRCLPNASAMLSRGGTAPPSEPPPSTAWLAYLIAATCAVLVIGGVGVRHFRARRRPPGADQERVGLLEVVATVIGICAGVAGLTTLFVPDLAADERPAKSVEMSVRSVNTRIRHDEFVKHEAPATELNGNDRLEVGNVVWLHFHIVGYRGTKLRLQWGSFEHKVGGALIAATSATTEFTPPRDDVVHFQPVWVGYPNVNFRVEFRLLLARTGQLLEMAKTDEMNGTLPRYACRT